MPIDDIRNDPSKESPAEELKKSELGSWVLSKMTEWEDDRDSIHQKRWGQYERLWRGIWSQEDVQRKSERSQLISPALSQSVESIVAEIEEAIFATGRFFDVDPDAREEDKEKLMILRDLLYNDMQTADVKSAISEIVLNGAIYGTGIGKIVVDTIQNKYITPKPVNGLPEVVEVGETGEEEVVIRLVSVSPREFVNDTSSKNLTDSQGMGHITIIPMHIIKSRIANGIYEDVNVSPHTGTLSSNLTQAEGIKATSDGAKILEYHGLVPVDMFSKEVLGEEISDLLAEEEDGDEDDTDLSEEMVEAIVTVTEGGDILRAIPNPNTLQDRNFLSFQFDTLPNQFWGRGVAEKGFNAQMALDSELRGRQDGMALAIHPMMAADASQMPRGADLRVRPGRTILTNGNPTDVLKPLNFGQLGTDTFTQSADLERMISKATGALDDAQLNTNGAKTGAMGMAISGAIKRSQRTLANVERSLITPMVHKFAWRYMQFAPDKYPIVENPKFSVTTSQGIMAKEWEVTQLGNMLKTVTPDSPAYWMLLKGIFQNSSIKNREEFDVVISSQLEKALNPQPSEVEMAQMQAQQAKLKIDMARARAELLRIELEAQKLETGTLKTYTEAVLNLAKAESEEAGTQINEYQAVLGRIKTGLEVNMKKQEAMVQQRAPAVPDVDPNQG